MLLRIEDRLRTIDRTEIPGIIVTMKDLGHFASRWNKDAVDALCKALCSFSDTFDTLIAALHSLPDPKTYAFHLPPKHETSISNSTKAPEPVVRTITITGSVLNIFVWTPSST